MAGLSNLIRDLDGLKDPSRARVLSSFFKTAPGQYGHGDVFLGITVPAQRAVAKRYLRLTLPEIKKLLAGSIHEFRFTALEILVMKFRAAAPAEQKLIYKFYLLNSTRANNWDLVDASAPYIMGEYLAARPRNILYKFARSKNLWQRRIAIVATHAFIKRGDFYDALRIAKILLRDRHDLIHKAAGWMLREVGKRDARILRNFLQQNYNNLPRTTLRYAIERFPAGERKRYLAGNL